MPEADTAAGRGPAVESIQGVKFGAFVGVFTPTLLTILGVIMYVRLPWLVGNAGLLGAWLLMAAAMGITVCTGLSLSSIATNTRIGAGGPYAIIQKSLGFEVGGSIGIPLYLTRPLGTAMYVFGFREGWLWIFPDHPALAVDLVVFALLFALAYKGADLAFKVQFVTMGVIVVSLVSIIASPALQQATGEIALLGNYPGFPEDGFQGVSPWVAFAIFFPATTGILAGANMSGDLKDPRSAIPRGTLWAILVSCIIYFGLAWMAARMGSTEELTSNYNLFIDRALWPPAVVAGLLGATFSSALAGSVGGPRILMAMADHRIPPYSPWLSRRSTDGEPRNAVLVTGVLTLLALMMRDLNAIAPLLTMFFLITYSMINVVLLLESSLGLVSFRPALRLPRIVPLMGAVGGALVMFVIHPTFSLVAVLAVVGIYIWILRLRLESHGEDVRSSIFVAVAEWSAAKVSELDRSNLRAWKPNLLVPFEDPAEIRGEFRFLVDACLPEGSVKLLGLATRDDVPDLAERTARLSTAFSQHQVFSNWSVVRSDGFTHGVVTSLQALQSAFFRPNLLALLSTDHVERQIELGEIADQARRTGVGVLLLMMHPKAGLGVMSGINVWLREPASWDLEEAFRQSNVDLALLMGYRLSRAWGCDLTLTYVVEDGASRERAGYLLWQICESVRLPKSTKRLVLVGRFPEATTQGPLCDLHILGMSPSLDFARMAEISRLTRASCLFVADSGRESARA